MVSIGEYDVRVLKAIALSGGTINADNPCLDIDTEGLSDSLERLVAAEYLHLSHEELVLTDIAEEYLELLGIT